MRKLFAVILTCMMILASVGTVSYADEETEQEAGAVYNKDAAENIIQRIEEYADPYLGTNTLINYDNGRAIQCHAFTNYIWRNVYGYDVYSSKCKRTETSNDYENLGNYINQYARPGDMLRVDGKHSMVITSFDEETVSGYDWLTNKKERQCTYTWEGVKKWGDGTQNYFLYQMDDSVYNLFVDSEYKTGTLFGPKPGEKTDSGEEDAESDQDVDRDEEDDASDDGEDSDNDDSEYGKIVVQINNPIMTADGEYMNIDAAGTVPLIVNDRTVLPIRAVIEAMGGEVEWDNDARTVGVNYKGVEMTMTIDSATMTVDGKEIPMDVAPVIINERTMLPIRYITENLGGEVEWFDSIQAVAITYKR